MVGPKLAEETKTTRFLRRRTELVGSELTEGQKIWPFLPCERLKTSHIRRQFKSFNLAMPPSCLEASVSSPPEGFDPLSIRSGTGSVFLIFMLIF